MAPASRTIASLIGGVSQQSAALRRPNQMEAQSNCYPSVVRGNMKRPPTEYVAKLMNTPVSDAHVHTIERDVSERYKVVLLNGTLKVFDINGAEKTVTFPDGDDYLDTSTPKQSFRCFTIADYTFIVNNTVEAAMAPDVTATRGYEALVYVKQVELDYHYKVTVNGTEYDYQTHHETPPSAAEIAEELATLMSGLTVARDRSTLHITDASALDVRAIGPNGDIDMRVFNKTTQNFSDLPTAAPEGYHIRVIGAQGNDTDDYYVKFVTNTGSGVGDGYWQETVAEGVQYSLDAATMPHVLIRNGDGTFTFQEATYTDRACGDDTTNPIPSFIGKTINDVTFHKGRLGFLSESNYIGSESGKFFNFFRTTVTALLDTDPIDVSVNEAVILRSAIEFDQNLLLTTDKKHFILTGGDLLTPKSATTAPATKFDTVPSTQPIATDKAVFFATQKGGYAGIREMLIDPVSGKPDPQDITQHVPKFIPGTIVKMAVSQEDNCLVALTDDDASSLYVYNYFWNGNQKLQSAWGTWDFNAPILDVEFLNSALYIIVSRADGVFLLKIDVSIARVDSNDVDHLTHLDMRLTEAQCSGIYVPSIDRTVFTIPYDVTDPLSCVTRYAAPGDVAGVLLDEELQTDGTNHFSVAGDQTGLKFYVGEKYTQTFTFSEQFVTIKDASGGDVIIPDGILKVLFATLVFEKTGAFKVTVAYNHRPNAPSVVEFEGRTIGSEDNELDAVSIADGKLRVRVGGDSKRITITVSNDTFLPSNFQSASLECNETGRARTHG